MNEHEQRAYELGVEHAKNAASWIIDGNTPQDHIARMVAWLDDGDPQAEQWMPARPNLSGEWADDLTPASLARDIAGDEYDDLPGRVDALADAYEAGVDEHVRSRVRAHSARCAGQLAPRDAALGHPRGSRPRRRLRITPTA